jgi:hypothetical protein
MNSSRLGRLVCLAAFLLVNNAVRAQTWSDAVEVLSWHGGNQNGLSVTVDPAGNWHLVYAEDVSGIIYASSLTSPAPIPATVGTTGLHPSIATDAVGHVHIAYMDLSRESPAILMIDNASGSWSVPDTIVSPLLSADQEYGLSLAIDDCGCWHVAYHDEEDIGAETERTYVMYANCETASQVVQMLELTCPDDQCDGYEIAHEVALDVDEQCNPHIAYKTTRLGLHKPYSSIWYTAKFNDSWTEPLNHVPMLYCGDCGIDIAVDRLGDWHLVYFDEHTDPFGTTKDWIKYGTQFANLATATFTEEEQIRDGTALGWYPTIAYHRETGLHAMYTEADYDSGEVSDERTMYLTDPTTNVFEAGETSDVPNIATLKQNYPNPFNASTVIEFKLDRQCGTTIEILDVLGHCVRQLQLGSMPPGSHRVNWDGCDDHGRQLASGVYFYRITAGASREARKMLLLK